MRARIVKKGDVKHNNHSRIDDSNGDSDSESDSGDVSAVQNFENNETKNLRKLGFIVPWKSAIITFVMGIGIGILITTMYFKLSGQKCCSKSSSGIDSYDEPFILQR